MKILNYRTFLYTGANVLIGSFVGVLLCVNLILGILAFCVGIIVNLILLIYNFKSVKYAVGFGVSAIALISMLILSLITYNFEYANLDYTEAHEVSGTVYSVENDDIGECRIIIDDISIDNIDCRGKMDVYIETEFADKTEFLKEGYTVKFVGKIIKVDLVDNGFINTYTTSKNIRYTSYIDSNSFDYEATDVGFLNRLHNKLKLMLTDFMGNHYGNIAYGMLTGNRNGLESATQNYFSASGLGHILAVSGLHIGFLISMLLLLLKRLSPKIKLPIVILCMTLYAIFAGFSFSVIRATIMSTVGLATIVNGQRSDLLNNLSLAFTIILATAPFALFEAGFLMSFCAVFGIACFYNTFNRLLRRIKFPRILSSSISVAVSAQIGITPCLLFYFHNLPLYSIVANIVFMPIITIAFVLLLLTSLICLIVSNSVLLIIPQTFLIILDGGAQFIASLPLSQLVVYVNGAIFILLPLYFIASKYVMLSKFKWIVNLVVIVCCTTLGITTITTFKYDNVIIPINTYNDVSSLVVKDGQIFLIGDCRNGKQIKRAVINRNITAIDSIFLTSMSSSTAANLIYLKENVKCGTVYCPYSNNMDGLDILAENDIKIEIFDMTDTIFETVGCEYTDSKFSAYSIEVAERKKALFMSNNTEYAKLDPKILNQAAVLRCKLFTGYLSDRIFLTNFSLDSIEEAGKYVYSVDEIGGYVFDYSSGKIYM